MRGATQPLRRLTRPAVLAALVVLVLFVAAWWLVSQELVTDNRPASTAAVTTIAWSPQTARELAHVFDGRVRIVWLRAEEWRERRGPVGPPQVDNQRFVFTPDPRAEPTDLIEPGAFFDGGGKDAEVPGVGRWVDRRGAFAVWGLDTQDGREREFVPVGRHFNPLLTPDGRRIIYTREVISAEGSARSQAYELDWEGGVERLLTQGYVLAVHDDLQTGERWLYGTDHFNEVWRQPGDREDRRQVIYRGPLSRRFSLDGAGRTASGEFPWPHVGVLDLTTGRIERQGLRDGCNSSIAPDGSGFVSILNGSHDGVTIFDAQRRAAEIDLLPPAMKPTANGLRGKVWNPRWAGDSRHLILSGPIRSRQADAADLWVGAFTPDRRMISTWIQVTSSDAFDVSPFLWRETDVLVERRHQPPVIVATQVVGTAQALVSFASPVRGDGMQVEDPVGLVSMEPFSDDRTVLMSFDRPLPASFRLKVTVPTDDGSSATVQTDVRNVRWPSDRQGLVARWLGNAEHDVVLAGRTLITLRPSVTGAARRDRDGSLLLLGGRYRLEAERVSVDGPVAVDGSALQISIAFRLHQSGTGAASVRLADFSSCLKDDATLLIEEHAGALRAVVGKQHPQALALGVVRDRDRHTLSLSCRDGDFTAHLDGQEVARALGVGDLHLSDDGIVIEGHGHGRLHGIALARQAYAPASVLADHRTQQALATPLPSHHLRVRVGRRSRPPPLADIHPYRNALTVNAYEVVQGDETIAAGNTVLVAQWAYLDGEPMNQPGGLGDVMDLRIEPFADHPELGAAYRVDTLDLPGIPVYVESDR